MLCKAVLPDGVPLPRTHFDLNCQKFRFSPQISYVSVPTEEEASENFLKKSIKFFFFFHFFNLENPQKLEKIPPTRQHCSESLQSKRDSVQSPNRRTNSVPKSPRDNYKYLRRINVSETFVHTLQRRRIGVMAGNDVNLVNVRKSMYVKMTFCEQKELFDVYTISRV